MNDIYQKHLFIGALKNLLKFSKYFSKIPRSEAAVLSCSVTNVSLKNTQNSQENARIHFLKSLQK